MITNGNYLYYVVEKKFYLPFFSVFYLLSIFFGVQTKFCNNFHVRGAHNMQIKNTSNKGVD